ncbi:MAG: asparagine synthase-related protein [Gemmataceae bacterium]
MPAGGPAGDALGGMIAADVETVLPDDFLVKVDRASMACGLEVRPPLLDHELLEMAASIPSRWKVQRRDEMFKRDGPAAAGRGADPSQTRFRRAD